MKRFWTYSCYEKSAGSVVTRWAPIGAFWRSNLLLLISAWQCTNQNMQTSLLEMHYSLLEVLNLNSIPACQGCSKCLLLPELFGFVSHHGESSSVYSHGCGCTQADGRRPRANPDRRWRWKQSLGQAKSPRRSAWWERHWPTPHHPLWDGPLVPVPRQKTNILKHPCGKQYLNGFLQLWMMSRPRPVKYNFNALRNTTCMQNNGMIRADEWHDHVRIHLLPKLQDGHWPKRRGGLGSLAAWPPEPEGALWPLQSAVREGLWPPERWNRRPQGLWCLWT